MTDWSPPASDAGWQPPESDRPRLSPEEEALNTQIEGETGAGEVAAAVLPQLVNPAPGIGYIKGMLTPGGDSLETARRFQRATTYEPRTEAGKAGLAALGDVASRVKAAAEPIIRASAAGPLYDATQTDTGKEVTERAGDVASLLPLVGAVSRVARGAGAVEAAAAPKPISPPVPVTGPVTAAELRAGPDPFATPPKAAPQAPAVVHEPPATPTPGNPVTDANGAVRYASLQELAEKGGRVPPAPVPERVPVPGKPHIRPKAVTVEPEPVTAAPTTPEAATPAPVSNAPKFEAPQQAGRVHGSVSEPEQGTRTQALHDLNEASGGVLPEVRTSAITGGYNETGQDFHHAKSPDAGGNRMGGVIGGENEAMKAASERSVKETGGVAKGIEPDALQERGTVIDRALTGVRDWFDENVKALYRGADAAAGGVPVTKLDALHGVLSDPSRFTGAEGMQLHGDVSRMAKHFGLMGDDGFWKPTTVENVERFRSWVGEQYTPRTGKAVRALKDALDLDVAAHGGADFYPKARALRQKQDAMLEGPNGIAKLIPEKNPDGTNSINRPVPIAGVADHLANMPKEQFDHVVNVLRSSAHLGNGELAENAAAALREIKGHMAEKLHEAGASARDGKWDPYKYHDQLNKYSLKMPAVFHPNEISRFQTLNRAGNVLRMDKSYVGASAQQQIHGGMGLRERLGNAAESELGALLPPGANTIGELTGVSQKLRDTFKGGGGSKHLAEVEGRITKLGERGGNAPEPTKPSVTPLGQVLGGGKQGGFIGARKSPVTNNASGESAASVEAINRGSRNLDLVKPDGSHEPVMRGVNQVDQQAPNGHLLVDRDTNEIVSRGQDLNAQNANGLRARYVAQREPTTSLGQRLYGAKQRGGPKFNPKPSAAAAAQDDWLGEGSTAATAPAPASPKYDASRPMINIGLHEGDPEKGGRVIPREEALRALQDTGVDVHRANVVQSGTEPTMVASMDRALTDEEAHGLSQQLGQQAVAQRSVDGTGTMHGPAVRDGTAAAQGWDKYSPDYFRMHTGETASEHSTSERKPGPGTQTVTNPVRNAFPGIYDDPHDIISRLKVAPEDPILNQLFSTSRRKLSDIARGRVGNLPGDLPGAAAKPKGSKAASAVMTQENADRLTGLLNAAKEYPSLRDGMTGWYVMDPLYDKFKEVLGDSKAAAVAYSKLNHFTGMASPGSDVETELNRGTAANMMHEQGKFDTFVKQGGRPEGARGKPAELANVRGHPYHPTAHAGPMQKYVSTGELQMESPKVPMYIQASGVPETGFQTRTPVGDSHWSRGVGLSDTRTNQGFAGSVSNPEMTQLAPWYRDKVAARAGLPAVSAQALQWGALGGETGVETAVGAPKLELFAQAVKKAAVRAGVTPEEMLKRIIKGTAHAG